MQVIIFKNAFGGISVVTPTHEALEEYGITKIAQKDVPPGVKYKLIDQNDVPTDPTERANWMLDDSEFLDGAGTDIKSF